MGMDVGGNKKGATAAINVTPLIDVVLVLLIIFMVLTPSMLKHMTANVPRKAPQDAPPPDPSNQPIVVEYTAKREITINTESVAFESLADKIADRLKFDRQKIVFFKIEDEALYGEVIKLMAHGRGPRRRRQDPRHCHQRALSGTPPRSAHFTLSREGPPSGSFRFSTSPLPLAGEVNAKGVGRGRPQPSEDRPPR
jgi:biopolymer transport protein TolR